MDIKTRKAITVGLDEYVCANCKNFIQYYYKFDEYGYFLVNSGHCVKPRIKKRSPCEEACMQFETNKTEIEFEKMNADGATPYVQEKKY